jgi:hypothetical protein
MNVMPIFCGAGLLLKKEALKQTGANVTQFAAGTSFNFRIFNDLRLSFFVTDEFLVTISTNNFKSKPAMEFARCVVAGNRLMANNSYRTNAIGKVASYENSHRI